VMDWGWGHFALHPASAPTPASGACRRHYPTDKHCPPGTPGDPNPTDCQL
jgi:hypothetical protein